MAGSAYVEVPTPTTMTPTINGSRNWRAKNVPAQAAFFFKCSISSVSSSMSSLELPLATSSIEPPPPFEPVRFGPWPPKARCLTCR